MMPDEQPTKPARGAPSTVDSYLQLLLDGPDDLALVNAIFGRLCCVYDSSGPQGLATLPEHQRVLNEVYGSYGLIETDGFAGLFMADHELAEIERMAEAYAAIGAHTPAEAFRKAIRISLGPPSEAGRQAISRLNAVMFRSRREIVEKLATFVRAAPERFSDLNPTPTEDLNELRRKNRPAPSQKASAEEVASWLKSVGGYGVIEATADGDAWVRRAKLREHRRSSAAELQSLGSFRAASRLQGLSLWGCRIRDDDLSPLRQFHALERLVLNGTGIGDGALRHVACCFALQELWMSSASATDAGIGQLQVLKRLRSINIASTLIGDVGVRQLVSDNPSLRDINLHGCPVTDLSVECLTALPSLERIDLRKTQVSEHGLQRLCRIHSSAKVVSDGR